MRAALAVILAPVLLIAIAAHAAAAPDRARLEAFLEVTGFDVALDSIKLSAGSAPQLLGHEADDFGLQWTQLVDEVFAPEIMHNMALDILSETLEADPLAHAAAFYASDLGRRLVQAENASHMMQDDAAKRGAGEAILDGLRGLGSARLAELQRLNAASGGADHAVSAIQEIQIRFLMAAASAGVITLRTDEEGLRALMNAEADTLRQSIQSSALAGSAYTYQAFSDAEVSAYADALEHPQMQHVYALMNAVQFEIMANRFEAIAARMAQLTPVQEL